MKRILPFDNENAAVRYGNVKDLVDMLNGGTFPDSARSYGFLETDIPGTYNERQWRDAGRCMPKHTLGLFIVFANPKADFGEKTRTHTFKTDDIKKVFAVTYNHWEGTYSKYDERGCGFYDGTDLKNTNKIPLMADI